MVEIETLRKPLVFESESKMIEIITSSFDNISAEEPEEGDKFSLLDLLLCYLLYSCKDQFPDFFSSNRHYGMYLLSHALDVHLKLSNITDLEFDSGILRFVAKMSRLELLDKIKYVWSPESFIFL